MVGFTGLHSYTILCLTLLTFFPNINSTSIETLTATQSLSINQTLVSPSQIFELGFFSPRDSSWYLGIRYKNISEKAIVWVANRDTPLSDSTGICKIGEHGNIVLVGKGGKFIWSSNKTEAETPIVQLLDSGNLVIREAKGVDPNKFLWQSFDFPTDTLLPGMKLAWDLDSGTERSITSWKDKDDPSTGEFSFRIDYHGFPEIFLWDKQVRSYRSGPWNGLRFSGVPEMQPTIKIEFDFVTNEHGVYYSFSLTNSTFLSRLIVNSEGVLQRLTWIASSQQWHVFWFAPKDQCDGYKECGPYGICDTNSSPTMTLEDCKNLCLKNCSCTAYANAEITNGGTGCVMWNGELIDMRQYPAGGQDLYVRLAASEIDDSGGTGSEGGSDKTKQTIKVVGITVAAAIVLLGMGIYFLCKKRTMQSICKGKTEHKVSFERSRDFLLNEVVVSSTREYSGECNTDEPELPLFDFGTIALATNNFSEENKLGEGGFGSVYRGRLIEGQEIAVKRLSKTSGQGVDEFKNEVRLIVRLQHRNLVRLLGCCVETDEKMLIYEYMEHKSLDSFIFDKEKRSLLNWQRRFNIICGIARGLLYLHQDSRFRIIHRDLKASNILLDGVMNPKISDFGMARIFGTDQTEANTKRVVGTYGYMSPEYAMDGLFSVKSDVFSFGVLLLEIIMGKKNRGFYSNNELNLLGHAWTLWKEGKGLELIDSSIGDSYSVSEVLRCIQVGLLCVQQHAEDRPTMSTVVLMLSSENASMPQPKNPGFCLGKNPVETDSSSSKQEESCTVNYVTVTMLDAR
ncbi:Receptor protein kinase [Quillaja saponaria]|uniref:Receptor-like serine/threonine-protein kinase n=1 Tax=Quillaja saponaria TaxID=32244 RepID=A0AAD7KVW7_QUISA|nr:Receptor protein kinase [Quillaja saponaria]